MAGELVAETTRDVSRAIQGEIAEWNLSDHDARGVRTPAIAGRGLGLSPR